MNFLWWHLALPDSFAIGPCHLTYCGILRMRLKILMTQTGAAPIPESNWRSSFMQVMMCIVANTALLSSGMTLGFTAVALPYMETPNPLLHVTKNQSSWIATCASLSIPLGCIATGFLMDIAGRRSALLFSCIPAALGWFIMAAFPSLPGIYIGRILTGFATGVSSTPATVFIAEGATPVLRGFLVTGTSIAISAGVSIVYILGLFLKEDWRLLSAVCGMFPVVSVFCLLVWMPESPSWLAARGRTTQAGKSLAKMRASSNEAPAVVSELQDITRRVMTADKPTSTMDNMKTFLKPEAYKPFVIMNTFFLFQQLTGIFVVIFYAVDVVKEAGVTMDPFVVTVFIGITRLAFTIIAGWTSRHFGRRPCSLVSGVGMTISLLVLAGHLYFKVNQSEGRYDAVTPRSNISTTPLFLYSDNISVINEAGSDFISNVTTSTIIKGSQDKSLVPVISILIYILTSTVGFLTLPWSMLGEVFPTKIRGMASGLTTCITYIVSSITVKLYPDMLASLGKEGVFLFYGVMALLGTAWVALFLPETQGKTLAQVEQLFAGKSRRKGVEDEEALNMSKLPTIVPASKT